MTRERMKFYRIEAIVYVLKRIFGKLVRKGELK